MIQGTITDGLGKAKSFVEQYAEDLQKQLGFTPFPGTLNIDCKTMPVFSEHPLTLSPDLGGKVNCYPCEIQGCEQKVRGAIIVPEKTSHPTQIVEIIAENNLRLSLNLQKGDSVQCKLLE